MRRGSLRNNFMRWGLHQQRKWVASGGAGTPIGRPSPACGSSWRSRTPHNSVSSLRMLREGSRFSRCFPPLEQEPSLPGMRMPPIPRTAGVRSLERIILSGGSRGLSRRRKKGEDLAGNETTMTMTGNQQITRPRCAWAQSGLNIPYHDEEWGVPVHDEHKWFEFLILEGAQAGLSWDTTLKKPPRNRQLFARFHPQKSAP